MKRPVISEQDLLALVEGQLPRERAAVVRQALIENPALLRQVEAMRADRETLQQESATERAPQGIVAAAMARAASERDTGGAFAFDEHAAATETGSPWVRHRALLIAAVLALLMVGVIGLVSMSVGSGSDSPRPVEGTLTYATPEGMSDEEFDRIAKERQARAAAEGESPSSIMNLPQPVVPNLTAFEDDTVTDDDLIGPMPSPTDLASVSPDEAPAPELIDNTPTELAADELAPDMADVLESVITLAREGRLRVIVPTPPSRSMPQIADATADAWTWGAMNDASDEPSEHSASPARHARTPHERFTNGQSADASTYRVRLSASDDDATLRTSLDGLFDALTARGIDPMTTLRFETLETPIRMPSGTLSLDPADILWWTRDTSTWERRSPVVVEVRIEQPE